MVMMHLSTHQRTLRPTRLGSLRWGFSPKQPQVHCVLCNLQVNPTQKLLRLTCWHACGLWRLVPTLSTESVIAMDDGGDCPEAKLRMHREWECGWETALAAPSASPPLLHGEWRMETIGLPHAKDLENE